jgi:hypothetical protein
VQSKGTKSAEQFAAEYAARSGKTVEQLRQWGQGVFPCDCDYEECEGWQMVNGDDYRYWQRLREEIAEGRPTSPAAALDGALANVFGRFRRWQARN